MTSENERGDGVPCGQPRARGGFWKLVDGRLVELHEIDRGPYSALRPITRADLEQAEADHELMAAGYRCWLDRAAGSCLAPRSMSERAHEQTQKAYAEPRPAAPEVGDEQIPEIWRTVANVSGSLNALDETIAAHERKIGSVLRPPSPIAMPDSTRPDGHSILNDELLTIWHRLEAQIIALRELTDRVES